MKTPRIEWPTRRVKKEEVLNAIAMSQADAEGIITSAISLAEAMSNAGLEHMRPIVELNGSAAVNAWNSDADLLVEWFGAISRKSQAKDVYARLKKDNDRISNSTLTVRVRPPDRAVSSSSAQNLGSFLSPRTFMVRPIFILATYPEVRAGTIIHELMHEWFLDQKLNGSIVYGPDLARQLAAREPKKARRSAENYMQYCMDVYP